MFEHTVEVCPNDGTTLIGLTRDGLASTEPYATPREDLAPTREEDDRTLEHHHHDRDEEALGPGAMLGPTYRVIRRIGSGGMGAVYEVEHVRIKKRFAAKVLRRALSRIRENVRRIEREAVAAGRIDHENIIQVVNLDETSDGRVFLIEELLEGRDLSQLINGQAVALELLLNITVPVAEAVEAAHRAGIIHRDLKPANIFLADRGGAAIVKVLDFGISKMSEGGEPARLTTTGTIVGTPLYMAPEQTREGGIVDARSDVYALGVILYEMATGKPPFSSGTAVDVMMNHVGTVPDPIRTKNASLPESLEKIVARALEKDPEKRFGSMREMASALRALAVEKNITLEPPSERALSNPHRSTSRSNMISVAIAAAIAIAAITGVAVLASNTPPPVADVPKPPPETPIAAAPPKPPVTTTVAASPPTPAKIEVELELTSEPGGAQIISGGKIYGVTPAKIVLEKTDRPQPFQFTKTGYDKVEMNITADKSRQVLVTLKRAATKRVVPQQPEQVLPELPSR